VAPNRGKPVSGERLNALVDKVAGLQDKGYREQSLRIHPWACARCGRSFDQTNLHELTVHHRDHNHSNNPADGSNWEHLCVYCHDDEHERHERASARGRADPLTRDDTPQATYNPFANLQELLGSKTQDKR
jgi:hypothetical protein